MQDGLLSPGDVLNNTYRIEELVGEGGTGEVYRATNTAAERTVAIKILKSQFARDPKFLDLMRRELLSVADVVNDAVVRYYDLVRTEEFGGHYFLVMEFVGGHSLNDLMRKGPIDQDTLHRVAKRVASGLAACHASHIFHRDLSPDNIILRDGDPDRATLIDFGIAKDVRPDAKTVVGGGFAGKYEYAAPEQLDGLTDHRSDLYSLGMTLLAAARGESPKLGGSFVEIMKAKMMPVDISDQPEPFRGFLDRLLQLHADDRPQSAVEVQALLADGWGEDAVASEPAVAPASAAIAEPVVAAASAKGSGIEDLLAPEEDAAPPPARETLAKPKRREEPAAKRGGLGWLIGIGALGVAAAAAFFFMGREPELPLADPYRMKIEYASGAAGISGHAPSEEAVAALSTALADRIDMAGPPQIEAARGVPNENWSTVAAALAGALAQLDEGTLEISGTDAELAGLSPTPQVTERVTGEAERAASASGYRLSMNIQTAPQPLEAVRVAEIVRRAANCGPLANDLGAAGTYAPGQSIAISGAIAEPGDLDRLRGALESIADSREIDVSDVLVINESVCRVRALLPPEESRLHILYSSSLAGGGAVDGDAFDPNDYPVIELEVPSDLDGFLYVFFVDNEFNALHLRPAQTRPENELGKIGTVVGDMRRVQVTWPKELGSREQPAIGFTEPYGTSLVFAVIADAKLFPHLRADVEDTRELAPDLAAAIATHEARGGSIDQAQRFLLVDQ